MAATKFKVNLNYQPKDFFGKPIPDQVPNEDYSGYTIEPIYSAAKFLGRIMGMQKPETVNDMHKLYSIGYQLAQEQEFTLDEADYKYLRTFIESKSGLTPMIAKPMLQQLEAINK